MRVYSHGHEDFRSDNQIHFTAFQLEACNIVECANDITYTSSVCVQKASCLVHCTEEVANHVTFYSFSIGQLHVTVS